MSFAVILGSSRSDGNTAKLSKVISEQVNAQLIDLNQFDISVYDYHHHNQNDDFLHIIESLAQKTHIIFASPVYWYSMSAQMKVFFDRLSDLLTIRKELGRKLRGVKCSVIATGVQPELPSCFLQQFQLTFEYMGMELVNHHYACCPEDFLIQEHKHEIQGFIQNVA